MLKAIQSNSNCNCNFVRTKCAEIHFHKSEFTIRCTVCGVRTVNYEDFLKHFGSAHFEEFHAKHTAAHHNDPLQLLEKKYVHDQNKLTEKSYNGQLDAKESDNPAHILANEEHLTNHDIRNVNLNQPPDCHYIKKKTKFGDKSHAENQTNTNFHGNGNKIFDTVNIIYPDEIDLLAFNERDSSKSSDSDESVDWTKPYAPTLLKNHEKRPYKERNKAHTCNYCGRNFRRRYQLDTHLNIHTGSKPHQCDICGRLFRAVTTLTRHLNTHEQREAFQCKYCAKAFTHKAAHLSHELRHTQQRSVSCDECDKLFYTVNQMDTHKRKVHHKADDDALAFACDLCIKRYRSASMLSTHKFKKHYKMAKYSCEKCGKKFIDDDQLKMHRTIHEGSTIQTAIEIEPSKGFAGLFTL